MKHLVPAVTPSWFPSVQLGVTCLEVSFSPLSLPGWAQGDVRPPQGPPCWFCMQTWAQTDVTALFSAFPQKKQTSIKKGILVFTCVPRLPSSAELHPWAGASAQTGFRAAENIQLTFRVLFC